MNTVLTALFLLVALPPLRGRALPLAGTLVGDHVPLRPPSRGGNLVSNTVVVLVSLGVSPWVAVVVARLPRRHPQAGVPPEREDRGRADRRRRVGDARSRSSSSRRRSASRASSSRPSSTPGRRRSSWSAGWCSLTRHDHRDRSRRPRPSPRPEEAVRDDPRRDPPRRPTSVYESQTFILGPRVEAFEKAVASYVGARHAIGMSSGTDAQLAVDDGARRRAGRRRRDVALHVLLVGRRRRAARRATPSSCDIEPETFNVDPSKLEKAITPKTKLDPARPPLRPVRRHGSDSRRREAEGDSRPRGRLPVARRGLQGRERPARSASSAPSRSSRRRTSAGSATAAW